MSLANISIYRDLPIIAGFVQVPPCQERDRTRLTDEAALDALPTASVLRLSLGSGRPRGSNYGHQEMLRLPAITPGTWYASDPVAALD